MNDLLKEAIADAKAVRTTALVNMLVNGGFIGLVVLVILASFFTDGK